jgi:hypothetical protein
MSGFSGPIEGQTLARRIRLDSGGQIVKPNKKSFNLELKNKSIQYFRNTYHGT